MKKIHDVVTILDNKYDQEREIDSGYGGYVLVIRSQEEFAVQYGIINNKGTIRGMDAKVEGIQQGEINTARRMLGKGLAIEDIADCVDLSVEEVLKLSN